MDTLEWLNLTPKLSDIDTWAKLWSVHDDPFPHIRCRICDGYLRPTVLALGLQSILTLGPACKPSK